jgi:hypothetical protein
MTKPTTPPAAESERSRRIARLEKLAQRFGNPFHMTQFARSPLSELRRYTIVSIVRTKSSMNPAT